MTIKIFVWLILVVGGNVYLDRKGPKRNYPSVFFARGFFAILHGAWVLSEKMDMVFDYSNASSLKLLGLWLPILAFQISSYWIFFELGLNAVTHRPLLYYDHQEGDSGYIDRFFKRTGPIAHIIAKVAAFIIFILSTINLLTRYA